MSLAAVALLVLVGGNLAALVAGALGKSRIHHAALWSGVLGLSVPIVIIVSSIWALATGLGEPSRVFPVFMALLVAAMVGATLTSVALAIIIFRQRVRAPA
jgi:predicted membrane protein